MNQMSTLAIIQVSNKVLSGFRQNILLKHTEVLLLSQQVELIFLRIRYVTQANHQATYFAIREKELLPYDVSFHPKTGIFKRCLQRSAHFTSFAPLAIKEISFDLEGNSFAYTQICAVDMPCGIQPERQEVYPWYSVRCKLYFDVSDIVGTLKSSQYLHLSY